MGTRDQAIDLVLAEMGYRPTYWRLVASVARDDRETRHAFEMLDLAGRIVDSLLAIPRRGHTLNGGLHGQTPDC
jgi:hypothetical protein